MNAINRLTDTSGICDIGVDKWIFNKEKNSQIKKGEKKKKEKWYLHMNEGYFYFVSKLSHKKEITYLLNSPKRVSREYYPC